MKNQVIYYRGAKTTLTELNKDLATHHHFPIQYRGQRGELNLGTHEKLTRTITYRGAKAEMAI